MVNVLDYGLEERAMRRCFVVCAFGHRDGTDEERRLFAELSGLYSCVFKKTELLCKQQGIDINIFDGRFDNGRHVFSVTQESIDKADAVIVVLTADNPNVFLELGWAHAMWHDPILLLREGYRPPIDINSLLGVPFSTAQVEGLDEAGAALTAQKLADKIRERIVSGRQEKPFDHWPDTTLARGGIKVYNRFGRGISIEDWSAMLKEADREIIVASSGMSRIYDQRMYWTDHARGETEISFGQLLLLKAFEGVNVTVLMYHEDNFTPHHTKPHETDLDDLKSEVGRVFVKWSTIRLTYETARQAAEQQGGSPDFNPGGSFRIVQLRKRFLPFRVTLTEKRLLLTLRFYTEILNSGLCIDTLAPTGGPKPHNVPVYTHVRRELDHLIEPDVGASEERYQQWVSSRRS